MLFSWIYFIVLIDIDFSPMKKINCFWKSDNLRILLFSWLLLLQALHFLREEFQPVAQSPVLHQLDKTHLIEVLKSPFLQASELEVLHAVLKWGEHELVRRMEDRGEYRSCYFSYNGKHLRHIADGINKKRIFD